MNIHANNATDIDVGTPPRALETFRKFTFHFHGFEDLPTERGRAVTSSRVNCFGSDWSLRIYPGGTADADDEYVSVYLCKSEDNKALCVDFEVYVQNWDAENWDIHDIGDGSLSKESSSHGWANFIKRSDVLDPSNRILFDGTLSVVLKLKPHRCHQPLELYLPRYSSDDFMHKLFDEDNALKDVRFLIGSEEIYAHSLILRTCAPCLFEFCKPNEAEAVVQIPRVESHIFKLLLRYLYRVPIEVECWKDHSLELLEAADRYHVRDLKLAAEAWYVHFTEITSDNVGELGAYAKAKNCALLAEAVADYSAKQIPWLELKEKAGNDADFEAMRVSRLRRTLDDLGLDTDGSRETLIKRLEAYWEF